MDAPALTSASAPSANPSAEQKDDLEMSEDSVMKRLLSMEESPSDLVKKLKDHAKELRKERNKCKKDLRNAVRRNKRLREKPRIYATTIWLIFCACGPRRKVKGNRLSQMANPIPKQGLPVAVGPEHQAPQEIHQPVLCHSWRPPPPPQKQPRLSPANQQDDAEDNEK